MSKLSNGLYIFSLKSSCHRQCIEEERISLSISITVTVRIWRKIWSLFILFKKEGGQLKQVTLKIQRNVQSEKNCVVKAKPGFLGILIVILTYHGNVIFKYI